MYCTTLSLYGSKQYPLALTALYGAIAEKYQLPELELLQESLHDEVQWPATERLQVYFLDSLTERNEKDLFQVRFAPFHEMRDLISIFLSVQESRLQNMTVQFPGVSGRGAFSTILGLLKSTSYTLHMRPGEFEFQAEGFPEAGTTKYIREHSLTSFVWVEGLGRYIHVREDPSRFQEVRRGRTSL
jgi:hypothetical protein